MSNKRREAVAEALELLGFDPDADADNREYVGAVYDAGAQDANDRIARAVERCKWKKASGLRGGPIAAAEARAANQARKEILNILQPEEQDDADSI